MDNQIKTSLMKIYIYIYSNGVIELIQFLWFHPSLCLPLFCPLSSLISSTVRSSLLHCLPISAMRYWSRSVVSRSACSDRLRHKAMDLQISIPPRCWPAFRQSCARKFCWIKVSVSRVNFSWHPPRTVEYLCPSSSFYALKLYIISILIKNLSVPPFPIKQ